MRTQPNRVVGAGLPGTTSLEATPKRNLTLHGVLA